MNGSPLTHAHGYPVRAVLPGIAGARWVKWLERITVQDTESPNHYQQRDYKILPPAATDAKAAEQYWGTTPPIQTMPVNSAIGFPRSGERISLDSEGMIEAKGYAVPEGDQGPITRVDVSGDKGKTWQRAELLGSAQAGKWAWTLWRAQVRVERGERRAIWSRAIDGAGNIQAAKPTWNLRGVAYNGYGEASDLTVT
jgi:sulfite oxidase